MSASSSLVVSSYILLFYIIHDFKGILDFQRFYHATLRLSLL